MYITDIRTIKLNQYIILQYYKHHLLIVLSILTLLAASVAMVVSTCEKPTPHIPVSF